MGSKVGPRGNIVIPWQDDNFDVVELVKDLHSTFLQIKGGGPLSQTL